jgi:hypothetical protein
MMEVWLAERVGFVPDEPAHINNLGRFSVDQIARNAQNLSIRYKTGTAQSDFQRYPSRVEAISVADKNLGAAHPLLRSSVPPLRFHATVRPVVSRSDGSLQASSWPVPAMSGNQPHGHRRRVREGRRS